jgi:hypothetical protein
MKEKEKMLDILINFPFFIKRKRLFPFNDVRLIATMGDAVDADIVIAGVRFGYMTYMTHPNGFFFVNTVAFDKNYPHHPNDWDEYSDIRTVKKLKKFISEKLYPNFDEIIQQHESNCLFNGMRADDEYGYNFAEIETRRIDSLINKYIPIADKGCLDWLRVQIYKGIF